MAALNGHAAKNGDARAGQGRDEIEGLVVDKLPGTEMERVKRPSEESLANGNGTMAEVDLTAPVEREARGSRRCKVDVRVNIIRFLFLATGVWWGIGLQLMVYSGVARNEMAQLPTLDWYGGMLLSLLPGRFVSVSGSRADPSCTLRLGRLRPQAVPRWRPLVSNPDVIMASLCDVFGTITTAIGMTMSGSAIFGIVFSSVSSWAALLRWAILGERLRLVQLLGVLLVTAGLVLSGLDEDLSSVEGKRVVLGIVCTLGGTVAYGLEYVLCERALVTDPDLTPVDFLWYMGLWGTFLISIYILVFTVPHWEEMVAKPVRDGGASAAYLVFLFSSHTVNNWLHNITWFMICEKEGSVSTGLLQGLKAIMLFGASSLAFCHVQQSQCYTPFKGAATAVVVLGTLVYYSVPSVAAKRPSGPRDGDGGGRLQWRELTAVPSSTQEPSVP